MSENEWKAQWLEERREESQREDGVTTCGKILEL